MQWLGYPDFRKIENRLSLALLHGKGRFVSLESAPLITYPCNRVMRQERDNRYKAKRPERNFSEGSGIWTTVRKTISR
jgi:hypothetical protein